MRTFTFKGLFLTAVFMLLGCLSIQAADDDLITEQVTINMLYSAGYLSNRIESGKMYKITNLKIIGSINGTDLRTIREMAGSDYLDRPTKGKLSVLDLSEARIVAGGDPYYVFKSSSSTTDHYTSNDEIGYSAFLSCRSLTSLILPVGVTRISNFAFQHCSNLVSITLPTGITTIGYGTFSGCSSLASITLPTGITELGPGAFENCI